MLVIPPDLSDTRGEVGGSNVSVDVGCDGVGAGVGLIVGPVGLAVGSADGKWVGTCNRGTLLGAHPEVSESISCKGSRSPSTTRSASSGVISVSVATVVDCGRVERAMLIQSVDFQLQLGPVKSVATGNSRTSGVISSGTTMEGSSRTK